MKAEEFCRDCIHEDNQEMLCPVKERSIYEVEECPVWGAPKPASKKDLHCSECGLVVGHEDKFGHTWFVMTVNVITNLFNGEEKITCYYCREG